MLITKRLIDIILSSTALVILLPLFLPIIFLLLLTGEHYVFYLQKRIGYKGKEFHIIKFATMLKDSPNMGSGVYTAKNDPRILPFGNFLRKTKINELPQLLNVLKGDMSIVGPRPLVYKTFNFYPKEIRDQIITVKPGISGVQQIIFRSEDEMMLKANIPLEEFYIKNIAPLKAKLETWYVKNISLSVDLKIIFLTVLVVLNRRNNLIYRVFIDLPKMNL